MTLEQLQNQVPSAFATVPSFDRSKKYEMINTQNIVENLVSRGFTLDKAIQAKTRKSFWQGFQKHQLFFDIPGETNENHKFQLRLVNSHNGGSSLLIYLGIYVFVCSNGLVRANGQEEQLRVVHMGYKAKHVQEQVDRILDTIPNTRQVIQAMSTTLLPEDKQDEFVQYAIGLRWKKEDLTFDPLHLLSCYHYEQKENTVWNVYNRIQENMIKGFLYKDGRKTRKTRRVKGIDSDLKINQELWKYAENLVTA